MRKLPFIAALVLVISIGTALAQSDKQPQMSDQEKAMMAAWEKFATPGAPHKALAALAGAFDTKVTMWMAPGAPPSVSTGFSHNKMVLGDRYLEQTFNGTFNGMPFQGVGYTGYDNGKKQYFGTWMDNMSTGVMTSTGTSSDGKSFKFNTVNTDAMTGKDSLGQSVLNVGDADHHTMEMWGPGPDGKMFKMMQIDYTRKK